MYIISVLSNFTCYRLLLLDNNEWDIIIKKPENLFISSVHKLQTKFISIKSCTVLGVLCILSCPIVNQVIRSKCSPCVCFYDTIHCYLILFSVQTARGRNWQADKHILIMLSFWQGRQQFDVFIDYDYNPLIFNKPRFTHDKEFLFLIEQSLFLPDCW